MLLVSFASQNGVLLVYCCAIGIFSSRRIERATYRDVGVRYLRADTHPDHDTIAKFRREKLQAKLETDTGRALYALRKQTAEPVFGIVKEVMGFRQLLLRGLEKIEGEWQLVALAYNMKRLWNLKMAMG